MNEEKTPWYRRIPGYRSKTPWKMLIATIIYVVILNGIAQTTGNETASDEEQASTDEADEEQVEEAVEEEAEILEENDTEEVDLEEKQEKEEYEEFIQTNYDYMDEALSLVGMSMQNNEFEDREWREEMREDLAFVISWYESADNYGPIPSEHESFHNSYIGQLETISEHAASIKTELNQVSSDNINIDEMLHDLELLADNTEHFRNIDHDLIS